ncbi:MAG: hypothetical protein Unbinned465contig1000_43 [Prokaryotic dsDNA virus sp.]|nr:MAG: hypothetical protein Unbinned465contig1000_43 [Prokaryotic dsDNA virus sp.]|tara:strand:+ start:10364 stop:10759 length:396 start_codon:yes stop_codon:yes gene_type:complete
MNYAIKFINHDGKRETLCLTSDINILSVGLSSTFPGAECWVKGDSGTWRHVFTEGKEGIAGDAPDHFAEYIHLMLEVKEWGSRVRKYRKQQDSHPDILRALIDESKAKQDELADFDLANRYGECDFRPHWM